MGRPDMSPTRLVEGRRRCGVPHAQQGSSVEERLRKLLSGNVAIPARHGGSDQMSTLRNVGRSGRAAGEQQRVARVDPEDVVLGVAARITGRDKCRHVLDRAGGWYGWVGVDVSAALVAHCQPRPREAHRRGCRHQSARRRPTTGHVGAEHTGAPRWPVVAVYELHDVYWLIVNSTALRAGYFGWRHVIGQVLFNLEPNRRLVSANAGD
jgi:hypothetical protein